MQGRRRSFPANGHCDLTELALALNEGAGQLYAFDPVFEFYGFQLPAGGADSTESMMRNVAMVSSRLLSGSSLMPWRMASEAASISNLKT